MHIRNFLAASLFSIVSISIAAGEERSYGSVDLTGLARNDWHLNSSGLDIAMVCNVNGPDGFLSIRSGPGTNFKINRKLNQLAILELDINQRRGNWVRVNTAYRTHSKNGRRIAYKSLHVQGWTHNRFLCSFLD